ncbi:MAG: hypothetical protein A2Z99_19060 [Treponema sp. GWB1_62_6]|nr:MAG: hypothetical protein A2Y36_11020 [Treponema sp. GWA1_62_8]OHE65206.1 MAG: hypothetical protein A2Z99_19060 [Treponema sp. GWB1_62_6]OHE67678.1 MAG: hypothetical protein A2001_19365 [Treponema sp. GWC1_61_84]OHE72020.1 MAG: hypothetical protein A2413_13210 [Treponema sp. RIFOXYC1_FULL_61_9]HCM28873.1 hypothetical protein [Treponema sp.]
MKRSLSFVFILIACSLVAFAVPLTASWVEGDVSVKTGAAWKELSMGDKVDSASFVRLSSDSMAEFLAGGRRISLSAEGTYNLDDLLKNMAAKQADGNSAAAKMSRMVSGEKPRSTVVAGVRGDFEGAPAETTWAEDEAGPEELAADARAQVKAGAYRQAATLFAEAAGEALGDARDEYRYGQAWSLSMDGDAIGAIRALRDIPSAGPWAGPRAILLARAYLDSAAPAKAVAVLAEARKNAPFVADEEEIVRALEAEAKAALASK